MDLFELLFEAIITIFELKDSDSKFMRFIKILLVIVCLGVLGFVILALLIITFSSH